MSDILIDLTKPQHKGIEAALAAFATYNPGLADQIRRKLELKHRKAVDNPGG